jgi:hypothetical protein
LSIAGLIVLNFLSAADFEQKSDMKFCDLIQIFLPAFFVGWSRIESKKLYFDDVARGAVLGVLTNMVVAHHQNKIFLSPSIDSDEYGLNLSYKF